MNNKNLGENISLLPLGNKAEIYVSKNHTFGTDAVLLANFSLPKKGSLAVDLGTGCGIIPALWLRDNSLNQAYGLEISNEAVCLANKTAEHNNWQKKMLIINGDIKNAFESLPRAEFDLVTCNPPYKAAGSGLLSRTETDKAARHETLCSLDDVIRAAAGLLRFGGRFCMCQRPERLSEIFSLMSQNKIEPKRLRLVCKTEGCRPWLVLVEGRRGGNIGLEILPNLNIYKNSICKNHNGHMEYTQEMLAIYGAYKK